MTLFSPPFRPRRCPRSALFAALALGTAVLSAAPPSWDAWQQVQEITAPDATGLVRVDLPSATFSTAQPRLRDLRLAGPDGAEMPYHLVRPNTDQVWLDPVANMHTALQDGSTVIGIENQGVHAIRAVVLETPAATFLKGSTVEASNDGTVWQSLVRGEVLFREEGGASQLRISIPLSNWKFLRVLVDDRWSKSIAFTGASLERHQPATPQVPETVTVLGREELPGSSRLTLQLQTPRATLGMLRLETPEPLFHRKITLTAASGPHVTSSQTLATVTAFRLTWEGKERASLEIPVHREVEGGQLFLTIENGNSPPLHVEGVTGTRYPAGLLFQAKTPGPWRLYSGNPQATAPWYDLAGMESTLKAAPAIAAIAGPLQLNPSFRKDAGLPALGEGGFLDPAQWRRRKEVALSGSGVQSLELDLETMARSSGKDLRLVQNGRQIPYIKHPPSKSRQLPVEFTPDPDPKRPQVSRWLVHLPLDHTPVKELLLRSSTPVFQRHIRVQETIENAEGVRGAGFELGQGDWTQRPGQGGHALTLRVARAPAGRHLWLETDNGDNAPLELHSVVLVHEVFELRFRAIATNQVFLYYDYPRATEPRYDLRLVEQDLAAAMPAAATLGPEVLLTPVLEHEFGHQRQQGNFWLWMALTLMTGGLLWLVVKLLPEQPDER